MSRPSTTWLKTHPLAPHGQPFICAHCGVTVPEHAFGTHQRNHCPHCLRSLHVDIAVGDRRSLCQGIMDPISLWVRHGEELALLHRCRRCGFIRSNRVAGDDDRLELRRLTQLVHAAGEGL